MTQHCSQNTARATRHKRESRARPRITRQTHDALQPTTPVLPRYKRESRARSGLTRQTHDALQPKRGPCYPDTSENVEPDHDLHARHMKHGSQTRPEPTRYKREFRARPRLTRQTHDALQPKTRPVRTRYKREFRARPRHTRQTQDARQPQHGPC